MPFHRHVTWLECGDCDSPNSGVQSGCAMQSIMHQFGSFPGGSSPDVHLLRCDSATETESEITESSDVAELKYALGAKPHSRECCLEVLSGGRPTMLSVGERLHGLWVWPWRWVRGVCGRGTKKKEGALDLFVVDLSDRRSQ
eukprot:5026559-Prymnesium_polylepis.1